MAAASPRSVAWCLGVTCIGVVALTAGAGVAARAAGGGEERPDAARTVWLFFAPANGDLSKDVKALGELLAKQPGLRFRACLLTTDLETLAKPSTEFAATVGAIRSLPSTLFSGLDPGLRILDDEGLVAARRLGVEALPSWVYVVASGRAHVASGRGANLKGLLSCK